MMQLKGLVTKSSLIIALTSLMGCQAMDMTVSDYFKNHSKDYLVTGVIAPLAVPEGYTHELDNRYPLPCPLPVPGSVEPPPLSPPGFGDLT